MGLLACAAGAQLLQTSCIGNLQREMEILGAPEANLGQIYNSVLVNWFGPGVLNFW